MGSVVNVHWYGSDKDNLPPDTVYIGRSPKGEIDQDNPYGNPYSSKSGLYTHDECVALHRIYLYKQFLEDPSYLLVLKQRLENKDLACWCAQKTYHRSCHGNNFSHVLDFNVSDRLYDKSLLFYLMDDLRTVLTNLRNRMFKDTTDEEWIKIYISFGDTELEIKYLITLCRRHNLDKDQVQALISFIIIDLEQAYLESDMNNIEYRFNHIRWRIYRFMWGGDNPRENEPINPRDIIKPKKSKKLLLKSEPLS